ncbi:XRE family transcriptional regulator [Listeria monocytogenes]|uniref:helix-turn-helix domain-containing protein n=1 Tax=Listeria seeligeri TaxID=1640 RepID=UPI0010B462DA|nr:helix-turn-helix transcriptional regulator [Listeria seeligeri]EAC4184113.1 XRE family transcriptional regulator [Listeria monocytogenes]EEO3421843.1 helix-turn-helix transcriptional regulator [Listeria monocytogenes]MBF2629978.1 helix-turn-helix transcriptional regulator [Listeria seeligeri]
MTLVERIKKLCQEQKITLAELERKTKLSNGTVRRWDEKTPGIDKLQIVADYFNVSTDYLLNRTDIRNHNTDETQQLLKGHPEVLAYLQENTSDEDSMRLLKAFIEFQESQKRTK